MAENQGLETVSLSEKQSKSRRNRNLAIAICLGLLVALFYGATIVKLGPRVMDKPMITKQAD